MRAAEVKKTLKEHELDGVLISSYENRRYVSGFTGTDGLMLITNDEALLFVDGRYTLQAQLEAKEFTVIEFKANPFEILKDYNLKNLSIEDKKLPFGDYKKLKEILPQTHVHNGSWIFDDMRSVKSPDEISKIQKAALIADSAFEHILKFINVGMSEKEISLELEYFMRINGAQGISFDTIVASSARSALPHAQPTDREIEHGDILLMDYGCIFEGYCSDMTRTVVIGEINDEQRRIYEIVLAAQEAGLKSIKNNVKCKDVDLASREVIESSGYGQNFTHSLGHGVGINVHEQPVLSPRSDKILKTGNVVTVEPGIYIQNKFGVRIEDLVVVTEDGYINLTSSSKEIKII